MIVDLSNPEDFPKTFNLSFGSNELDLESELAELTGNASAAVSLSRRDIEILAEGELSAAIRIECSRCLKEIDDSIQVHFSARFVESAALDDHGELEISPVELDVSEIADDELDLKELVREQIVLALPARYICSDTCKGLCPICGGDRNLIDCKCEDNETDPRWSALKNLKL